MIPLTKEDIKMFLDHANESLAMMDAQKLVGAEPDRENLMNNQRIAYLAANLLDAINRQERCKMFHVDYVEAGASHCSSARSAVHYFSKLLSRIDELEEQTRI